MSGVSDDDVKRLLGDLEDGFAEWLPSTGAVRVDAVTNTLGLGAEGSVVLTMSDGSEEDVRTPSFFGVNDLRLHDLMVDPLRGAWTWAHFWMDVDDMVLHTKFDWMREPLFGWEEVPPSDEACVQELLERLFPDTPDIAGNGLFEWPDTREGVEARVGRVLEDWLPRTGAERVDIDSYVVDRYEVMDTRLRMPDGTSVAVTFTEPEAWFWGEQARRAGADPVRGVWTHAHLWMDVDEPVLHSEYEWDERPPFFDSMSAPEQASWCAKELKRYPRAPQHIPDWLDDGSEAAAAWDGPGSEPGV